MFKIARIFLLHLISLNIALPATELFAQTVNTHVVTLDLTPPMGWNSWNWFGKDNINEKVVMQVIDAMANNGLANAGYNYVVIDGGWRDKKLGLNGELLCHPIRFPHGIKPLADYAHSKGLKIGLHTVPGTNDCGGDPVGGFGNEEVQMKQFVDWGIDFIKLDKCLFTGGWNEKLLKDTYFKWSDLIKKSGKSIVLNISAYEFRDWYPDVSQMARTTLDIATNIHGGAHFDYVKKIRSPLSVMAIAELNNQKAKFMRQGYWNDADMLVTGRQGLTVEEQKAHFALWCIMSSPLFLGNDPRNMDIEEKDIVVNNFAIRVNQDPTEQGILVKDDGDKEVWAKRLKDGNMAILFLNRGNTINKINLDLKTFGFSSKARIFDIYQKRYLRKAEFSSMNIKPHAGIFIIAEKKSTNTN